MFGICSGCVALLEQSSLFQELKDTRSKSFGVCLGCVRVEFGMCSGYIWNEIGVKSRFALLEQSILSHELKDIHAILVFFNLNFYKRWIFWKMFI